MKYFRVITYIVTEMLPSLLVGIFVFIVILLMLQALRLTELMLTHNVSYKVIFQLISYLSVSFFPVILPMSVLFSVLVTYGKLSSDSEIIAFKSLGVSQKTLTIPAVIVGIFMTFLSAETFFFLGPKGHSQFSELIDEIAGSEVISNIHEGMFADGFYNLVVYANHVNETEGRLKDVFIYDGRSQSLPLAIVAQEGQILSGVGYAKTTILRLFNGSIHRSGEDGYTKIQFNNYDIFLTPKLAKANEELNESCMTITQLYNTIHGPKTFSDEKLKSLETEYYTRWALPLACIIFALIGVGLGTVINRRVARSGSFILSVGLLLAYYGLHVSMQTVAANGTLTPAVAIFLPNILFLIIAIFSLRYIWNK